MFTPISTAKTSTSVAGRLLTTLASTAATAAKPQQRSQPGTGRRWRTHPLGDAVAHNDRHHNAERQHEHQKRHIYGRRTIATAEVRRPARFQIAITDQIEIYFSVVQRKLLTPDDFPNLDVLSPANAKVPPPLRAGGPPRDAGYRRKSVAATWTYTPVSSAISRPRPRGSGPPFILPRMKPSSGSASITSNGALA